MCACIRRILVVEWKREKQYDLTLTLDSRCVLGDSSLSTGSRGANLSFGGAELGDPAAGCAV